MQRKDNNGHFVGIAKSVIEVWRSLPVGTEFHGWELRNKCVALHPELSGAYVDTFLRALRKYYSGNYKVISHSESLYKKVVG